MSIFNSGIDFRKKTGKKCSRFRNSASKQSKFVSYKSNKRLIQDIAAKKTFDQKHSQQTVGKQISNANNFKKKSKKLTLKLFEFLEQIMIDTLIKLNQFEKTGSKGEIILLGNLKIKLSKLGVDHDLNTIAIR